MTEKITKQYFCDFCGSEIDQTSKDAIRIFNTNHSKEGWLTIRPIKQCMDAHRHVVVLIKQGDFCSIDHFSQYIEEQLEKERKNKGVS